MKRMKTKQSLNLSSLQDFVLNERNIERILKYTIDKPVVSKKYIKQTTSPKKQLHTDFLLPKFTDTLFWCYYIIKNGLSAYEMVHGDGYKDSFEQKIDLVYKVRENKELLKKYKWKRNAIEDQLVNHTEITLSAFMCICAIQKLNIVYIDSKKIYTLIDNIDDLSSNLNIIEKTSKGYALFLGTNEEKYKKYTDNITKLWKLDNLHKPLRGISSYKVKELQEICRKLQLDILNDNKTKKTKKVLYQMIQEQL
jgi:hypothetical protein